MKMTVLDDLPMRDLKLLKKDEILKLIADSRTDTAVKTTPISPDSFAPLLNQLTSLIKPMLEESHKTLTEQFKETQAQLSDLQAKMISLELPAPLGSSPESVDETGDWSVVVRDKKDTKKAFSDVLKETVATAFHEEKNKCDVIISKATESKDDKKFLVDLCHTMNFPTMPRAHQRLGKKGNTPRLLKVTFPSAFDARSFKARYEDERRRGADDLPTIRVRSNKNKEERAIFAKSSKLAFDLNSHARKEKTAESFSLRDDGSIWRYAKSSDGKWKRDREWSPSVVASTESSVDVSADVIAHPSADFNSPNPGNE